MVDIKKLYELYQQHPCITTDSRDCPVGSIFLALKGETFDGNKFALQALEKGCAYAIVDDKDLFTTTKTTKTTLGDSLSPEEKELSKLSELSSNNGKTTTKELIAAVLSQKYNVLYTQGNFNNDVGVPKTLFRLTKEHEIAVIEMGASHPGDIKTLAETAEPTCGLITNVGRAHLLGFGSFEGVIRTKCELYDFLRSRQDSLIFINADSQIDDDEEIWMSPYSTDPDNWYSCISGEVIECNPFLKFRWREPLMVLEEEGRSTKWHKVQTQLIGSYNIDNLLAAIAVGINFGVDRKKICAALEEYVPSNNRSQMTVTAKNHLIVDAYNANPTSMHAALDNFSQINLPLTSDHSPLKKMAIIGQMGELGNESDKEHRLLVNRLASSGYDDVWLVGDNFRDIPCPFRKFHDVEEVKSAIAADCPEGFYILIKGSNSNKLFQLPELL